MIRNRREGELRYEKEMKSKESYDDQQNAIIDVIKSAYERGNTDSSLTTQEFVEEIKMKLMNIYT